MEPLYAVVGALIFFSIAYFVYKVIKGKGKVKLPWTETHQLTPEQREEIERRKPGKLEK